MVLYSSTTNHQSHRVRLVLAEKGLFARIVFVEPGSEPDDLKEVNPALTLPTYVDRELTLYGTPVIMEYMDERYPHPPLMPQLPVARSRMRLLMNRLEQDWSSRVDFVVGGKGRKSLLERAHKELRESIVASAPLFRENKYIIESEYSLADCCIAPILWRLDAMKISLPTRQARAIHSYMREIFSREAFLASLTEDERDMRA